MTYFFFFCALGFMSTSIIFFAKDRRWKKKFQEQTASFLKQNAEAKELENLKRDFVSLAAHDLRIPLTSISEASRLILDGTLGEINEKQKKFLRIGCSETVRLKKIIDVLLEMFKIEAGKIDIKKAHRNIADIALFAFGKVKLKKEHCDITDIASGILNLYYPLAKEKGLEIKKNFPDKKIEAYADKERIAQVLDNLISNSLKFTQSGSVEVSLREQKENIECSVSDTGVGISEDNIPRVFARFQQFEHSTNPKENGTALGLSLIRAIIELHKGDIAVESKLNAGTKFTFHIPKQEVING